MPAQLIELALARWREGERVLRDLPRLDPDHETVRQAVIRLRETYQDLAQSKALTVEQRGRVRREIESAHGVIARAESRVGGSSP